VRRSARAIIATFAVAVSTLASLPVSFTAAMQQPARTNRVGVLTTGTGSVERDLRESLRELGYIDGRDVVLEMRETKGRSELVDQLALELARLKVDVIVATNPAAVLGAKRATTTIPIVMVNTPDPVELGLVASLARPGGNITGVTSLSVDLTIKQLELLKEAVPRASRIAVLWNPDNPWHPVAVKGLREGSRSLGVQLQILEVRAFDEFESAFRTMIRERSQAVLVLADPMTFAHRHRLATLAVRYRLPLMSSLREYAEAGALMSYWADGRELLRRAASYVDRLLKGARPGDLPIEQPTKYELVVNPKTAKALALTIPQPLLLRATVLE
jgi:ABC-type uncharacterized transport system substrate-binding protein